MRLLPVALQALQKKHSQIRGRSVRCSAAAATAVQKCLVYAMFALQALH